MNHRTISHRERSLIGGLAAVFSLLLFVPIDTGANTFFWGPFFDAGHFGLFSAITFCLYAFLPLLRARSPFVQPIAVSLGIAVAAEIIQPVFGRSASLVDIGYGTLGTAFGGVAYRVYIGNYSKLSVAITACAAVALQLVLLAPTIPALNAIRWRSNSFPIIGDFENPIEEQLWRTVPANTKEGMPVPLAKSRSWISDVPGWSGSRSLEVQTQTGLYGGVGFAAGDQIWKGYTELVFTINNPSTAFDLLLRIDDNQKCETPDDRYAGERLIPPGTHEIAISLAEIENSPQHRKLDLNHIRRIIFFVSREESDRRFGIDNVRLR